MQHLPFLHVTKDEGMHGDRHALRLKRKKRWGVRRLCLWIKGPVTASGQRYRANLELKT